jgi:hypothetical protein
MKTSKLVTYFEFYVRGKIIQRQQVMDAPQKPSMGIVGIGRHSDQRPAQHKARAKKQFYIVSQLRNWIKESLEDNTPGLFAGRAGEVHLLGERHIFCKQPYGKTFLCIDSRRYQIF